MRMAEDVAQDLKFVNPISEDNWEQSDASLAFEDQIRRRVVAEGAEPHTPRNADMEDQMANKSFVEKLKAFIGLSLIHI